MMSQAEVEVVMRNVFDECQKLRGAGQAEYARAAENALANFERVAQHLGISREQVLFTYFFKHLDGVTSYINGHVSQRENVRGRINDMIVYLVLLRAMVEDKDRTENMVRQDPRTKPMSTGVMLETGRRFMETESPAAAPATEEREEYQI